MTKTRVFVGIVLVTFSLAVCFTIAYLLMQYVFSTNTTPPAMVSFLLTSGVGFLIFGISVRIIQLFHGDGRNEHFDEVLDALTKISHGNFDVLLEGKGMYIELTTAINQMAKDLGSLENLRQNFVSNVSHEIQSPLTSISGFAELLRNDNLSPEQRKHYIDVIETESKRLSKLSENLLKLSSLENNTQPIGNAPFPLHKQIENAVLMLEPQWSEKNIDIVLSLDKVTFSGDEGLLYQVWINLLHNAIKFTQQDGEIKVSLTKSEREIICEVSDNGIGIAPEDQIHIFERFYKADKSRNRSLGGNGLGLALSKKIVNLHGGTIVLHSEHQIGTTFRVVLSIA